MVDDLGAKRDKKRTMYEVIGSTVGMSARWVAFLVLAVFAASIELGIFVTSPHSAFFKEIPKPPLEPNDPKPPTPKMRVKRKPKKVEVKESVPLEPDPDNYPPEKVSEIPFEKPQRTFGRKSLQVSHYE